MSRSSTARSWRAPGALLGEHRELHQVRSDLRPRVQRALDHWIQECGVEIVVVPLAGSMPEATQLVDRIVQGQYRVTYSFDRSRCLLKELGMPLVAFRLRPVERLERFFKNRLDR